MAPAKVLVEHEEAQRAFEEAMATGREGVVNPSALLPVVRKIRFDPPRAEGGAAPLDIEDYGMAYAETVQAFTVDDALGPVWLLRMSREDGE
jgi:ATP-dependent Clp protease ATP-binding subunit ClpC